MRLPSIFYEKISPLTFAKIQDYLNEFRGFYIQPRTFRAYNHQSLGNVLGYIGEISRNQLNRDTTDYYRSGDLIGINGLEKQYEKHLRGKRGVSYRLVDVNRISKGEFRDGVFDTLPIPGKDIQLTIDLELQQYAEKLMDGKVGSIVAIEPKTGEILAFVSAPGYDPNLLTGREFSSNFQVLQNDTLKPLFNRPFQAMYPPGSMFKTIQALIALQEKVVYPKEKIYCDNTLIGDYAPIGSYDVKKAITFSSNNYFYKVFRRVLLQKEDPNIYIDSRIGLEKWREYIMRFGLGNRLGIDIPGEKSGYIPDINRYDRMYGTKRWRFSNIYSLSIGQGEVLVTPTQMANLGAILGNRGYYITPHFLKKIGDSTEIIYPKIDVGIDEEYFPSVIDGMEQVVTIGSGTRAYIPDIAICGKTSTVQNAGEDHSGFMAFAPKEDAQIAVAAYVENAGWGGRAAASVGSLIIEKHVRGYIDPSRQWLENYVLKGDFLYARRSVSESD